MAHTVKLKELNKVNLSEMSKFLKGRKIIAAKSLTMRTRNSYNTIGSEKVHNFRPRTQKCNSEKKLALP